MLIGHLSDLHGALKRVLDTNTNPDLWIATGDMFPNRTRGDVVVEVSHQRNWWDFYGKKISDRFQGRPVVVVDGNHDYISFAQALREHGVEAYDISESPTVLGMKFAGFREIPYIAGEWNGENHDFRSVVDEAFAQDPDILVTHAPPAGILDEDCHGAGYGINLLMQALSYRPHKIRAHFFGHAHECGGKTVEEMGIRFFNGATKVRFHSL